METVATLEEFHKFMAGRGIVGGTDTLLSAYEDRLANINELIRNAPNRESAARFQEQAKSIQAIIDSLKEYSIENDYAARHTVSMGSESVKTFENLHTSAGKAVEALEEYNAAASQFFSMRAGPGGYSFAKSLVKDTEAAAAATETFVDSYEGNLQTIAGAAESMLDTSIWDDWTKQKEDEKLLVDDLAGKYEEY